MATAHRDMTHLLEQWRMGDRQALDLVMERIYAELKHMAGGHLKRLPQGPSIFSPTVLVNEIYIKLLSFKDGRSWKRRGEFFALIATMMTHFLADHVKLRKARKHGGHLLRVSLSGSEAKEGISVDPIELQQALEQLERLASRQAMLWKCRYLAGLSITELEEAFEWSPATIHRELRAANGWVKYRLSKENK